MIRPEQLETPVEIVEAIFRRVGACATRETSSLMRDAMLYHCQTSVRIQQPLPDSGLSAYVQRPISVDRAAATKVSFWSKPTERLRWIERQVPGPARSRTVIPVSASSGRNAPIHAVQGAVPSSRYRTFISSNG